jgi:tRNA (guanine37-N1)-methyltransferase
MAPMPMAAEGRVPSPSPRKGESGMLEVAMRAPWTAVVLTIFPEMFPGPLGHSLAGRALQDGLWLLETVDMRDFARDKHRSVDDAPFGGGPGMIMRPDIVDAAIESAPGPGPVLYLTPRGRPLDQARLRELAAGPGMRIVCGRFEGIDQRVIEARGMEEISLGDFVLSGGEPAALALIDGCVRLLPGVVGDAAALVEESFARQGRAVPEVLLSGHHEEIRQWRQAQAEEATRQRRPDLWERYLAGQGRSRRS